MRKIIILTGLIGLSFILVLGPSVLAGDLLNGEEVETIASHENAMSCVIKDEFDNVVTQCRVSNPWSREIIGYWVEFYSSTPWTKATFKIKIKGSDLPEKTIISKFKIPEGYTGYTSTPFAITDWGDASKYGYGVVKVRTDVGDVTCTFDILP